MILIKLDPEFFPVWGIFVSYHDPKINIRIRINISDFNYRYKCLFYVLSKLFFFSFSCLRPGHHPGEHADGSHAAEQVPYVGFGI